MYASSPRMTSRAAALDVRLVRAVALATVSVALAGAAHTAAGGRVGCGELVYGWLLVAFAAAAGAGCRRSMPAIMGAFAAGQLGLHLLFRIGDSTPDGGANRAGTAGGSMPGHHMSQTVAATHAAAHTGLLGHSTAMSAGHAAASVATGWLLHRVEVALWRLLDLARTLRAAARRWRSRFADAFARLLGGGGPVAHPRPRAAAVPVGGSRLGPPLLLLHSVIRRGPPLTVGA